MILPPQYLFCLITTPILVGLIQMRGMCQSDYRETGFQEGLVATDSVTPGGLHRKKRFTSFPSPAGMSLTKLHLGRNNSVMTSLFPPRESLVVTSRLGTGNSRTFFLRCMKLTPPIVRHAQESLSQPGLKIWSMLLSKTHLKIIGNEKEGGSRWIQVLGIKSGTVAIDIFFFFWSCHLPLKYAFSFPPLTISDTVQTRPFHL